jgi:hypothetical protein
MAFIKSEIQVKDMQKGDVFRVVESNGNLKGTFEYEVVSLKTESVTLQVGDSGTVRQVDQCTLKVVNRKNGANKTKKYNSNQMLTVWRQA